MLLRPSGVVSWQVHTGAIDRGHYGQYASRASCAVMLHAVGMFAGRKPIEEFEIPAVGVWAGRGSWVPGGARWKHLEATTPLHTPASIHASAGVGGREEIRDDRAQATGGTRGMKGQTWLSRCMPGDNFSDDLFNMSGWDLGDLGSREEWDLRWVAAEPPKTASMS